MSNIISSQHETDANQVGIGLDDDDAGVPRSKRKKLRKEEIVAEATKLFAERGYEGASMGDLAERVGLRKASLFHHFPSKDVLYATVLGQLLDAVREAIQHALEAQGSFADRMDALNDAITTTLGAQPHAARLLVREAMDWGPVMRDKLGRQINDVLQAGVAFAREGQRDGTIDPDVDPMHIVVSNMGIFFMPFALGDVVERLTGASPFTPAFVEARKRAVNQQIRRMALKR